MHTHTHTYSVCIHDFQAKNSLIFFQRIFSLLSLIWDSKEHDNDDDSEERKVMSKWTKFGEEKVATSLLILWMWIYVKSNNIQSDTVFLKLNFKLQKPCECARSHAGWDSWSQISLGTLCGVGFVQGSAYQYTLLLLSLLFLQVSWVPGVFPYVCFNMQMQKNAT